MSCAKVKWPSMALIPIETRLWLPQGRRCMPMTAPRRKKITVGIEDGVQHPRIVNLPRHWDRMAELQADWHCPKAAASLAGLSIKVHQMPPPAWTSMRQIR